MMMAAQQQYVVLDPNQLPGVNSKSTAKVRYTKKMLKIIKVMTLAQLALGLIIIICHGVTLSTNYDVIRHVSRAESQREIEFSRDDFGRGKFLVHAPIGIWVGLVVIITAAIGLGGIRRQSKGLIVTHLMFNVLTIMMLIPLMVTIGISLQGLIRCRYQGMAVTREYHSIVNWCNKNPCPSTTPITADPINVLLYGEDLYFKDKADYAPFHCSASVFGTWMALESIILVSAVFGWIISLSLLIYNSKAACKSYCCICCCPTDAEQSSQVTYYAYPQQCGVPDPETQCMVQPTSIPPQYQYQKLTVMHTKPSNNPTVKYVSQTSQKLGAPSVCATNHQPGLAVAGRTVDQPPKYTEVEQNRANMAVLSQRADRNDKPAMQDD